MTEPFIDIYDQHASEITFLWMLWHNACMQPQHNVTSLQAHEARIFNHIAGLMVKPTLAWQLCEKLLEFEEPAEAFVATQVAFRSYKTERIKRVVDIATHNRQARVGVVSGVEWLPGDIAHGWVKKLLESKALEHKALALDICIARQENPEQYLTRLLERDDCRGNEEFMRAAIRCIGVFKRTDLLDVVKTMDKSHHDVMFALALNRVELDREIIRKWLNTSEGEAQREAAQIVFRSLSVTEARALISELAQVAGAKRQVITATGILGDPHAVPWLLNVMQEQEFARVAGEACCQILGIELNDTVLEAASPLSTEQEIDSDDTSLDEDEYLPWPNVNAINEYWEQQQKGNFMPGYRYFLGRPIQQEALLTVAANGNQRQRMAANYELAIQKSNYPLVNSCQRQTKRM